jgi:type III secretion protein T
VIETLNPGIGDPLLSAIPWLDQLLLVGVSSARFGFAFIFVPLFSKEAMPATVRNSIIITFGLVALAMHPDFAPKDLSASGWAIMILKEMAAGTIIGLFFGSVLWSLAAAGELIDTKVGATTAQLIDPLSGVTTSLNGVLLARFGQLIFVSMGGLTIMVGTVMQSYLIWPMGPAGINLDQASIVFFEGELSGMFSLCFFFAFPVLMMLYIIDLGLGFLNRFAQQFNVFSLGLPIKSVAATLILILTLPLLAQVVIADLRTRSAVASSMLGKTGQPSTASVPSAKQRTTAKAGEAQNEH